jgi:hypothetical protein
LNRNRVDAVGGRAHVGHDDAAAAEGGVD